MTPTTDEAAAKSSHLSSSGEYWGAKLGRPIRAAGLPVRHPQPSGPWTKTETIGLDIRGDSFAMLQRVTRGAPFLQCAAVMSAIAVCLYRYTELSPVTIGCPSLEDDTDAVIDANVVVIVNDVEPQMTFRTLLQNVRRTMLESHRHQRYSFAQILRDLGHEVGRGRCPLFDVAVGVKGLHQEMPEAGHGLTLMLEQEPGGLAGEVRFSPALYERATVERFCYHVAEVLRSGLDHPDGPIEDLNMVSDAERRLLLNSWNDTACSYPKERCVHELFEEWAAREPDRTALVYGSRRLTYRELDEAANQVAHRLQACEARADVPVGICVNRSPELVVALLGVLKAGAAYVPYDPSYPKNRLSVMFKDIRLKAVLTKESFLDRVPEDLPHVICLDRDAAEIARQPLEKPRKAYDPSNLCYVIFTSGTTGRPKASAVCHQGWMNLLHWFIREFEIGPLDKTLVTSSFSFDITQRSIAMPLTSGGELHLVASDDYDPELILRTIEGEQITQLNCAPSTFYPLIEDDRLQGAARLRSLRRLFLGGEAISASRLSRWATSPDCHAEIANVYGAAECTDVSSFHRLHDYERYAATSVPIGRPIYNSQVHVVEKEMRLAPVGVVGEICLAGTGVGRGYINDRKLTAEKFVDNPFASPGQRLYRTGDLGRWLADGSLEFVGRLDHQVKIRGQRIELGEIETRLRQDPAVTDAVVALREEAGHTRMVAYVVPAPGRSAADCTLGEQLRARLAATLPSYMIPNVFVLLAELPLSPNGKVDREALPEPPRPQSNAGDVPATTTELALMTLYSDILGVTEFGVHDDFFSLGGHSLLATQMIARITETMGVRLSADDFFAQPTVAGIAKHLESLGGSGVRGV